MSPTPAFPQNPDNHPRSPYPKVRFFADDKGTPFFEMITAKLAGGLEDGDTIKREVRPTDIEAYPEAWERFKATAPRKGKS